MVMQAGAWIWECATPSGLDTNLFMQDLWCYLPFSVVFYNECSKVIPEATWRAPDDGDKVCYTKPPKNPGENHGES